MTHSFSETRVSSCFEQYPLRMHLKSTTSGSRKWAKGPQRVRRYASQLNPQMMILSRLRIDTVQLKPMATSPKAPSDDIAENPLQWVVGGTRSTRIGDRPRAGELLPNADTLATVTQ